MQPQKARIEDVLNYQPETSLSPWEAKLIKDTFKDNDALIGVIRKIFLPTISDPTLPVEEMGKEMFLTRFDLAQIPEDQLKPIIMGMQMAAKQVLGGIIQLKVIANMKEESEQERKARLKANSSK